MRRRTMLAAALAAPVGAVGLAIADPAAAGPANAAGGAAGAGGWPGVIPLPDGWQPEGIVIRGTSCYVGSLRDGAIHRACLATGRGGVFVPGREGGQAVGLEIDPYDRIWACGSGGAAVYDARTGDRLAEYAFGGTFVNDAVATREAVYFTDSYRPFLYAVPLGRGGRLPDASAVRSLPLTGALAEDGAFNNGIETTPDGRRLLIVQMNAGRLLAYDPRSGETAPVDLGGAAVTDGDGLLRRDRTLYLVRNSSNLVAEFRLDRAGAAATLVREITDPAFDVPATIAAYGRYLYAVNGRFNIDPTPDTTYAVVRVAT